MLSCHGHSLFDSRVAQTPPVSHSFFSTLPLGFPDVCFISHLLPQRWMALNLWLLHCHSTNHYLLQWEGETWDMGGRRKSHGSRRQEKERDWGKCCALRKKRHMLLFITAGYGRELFTISHKMGKANYSWSLVLCPNCILHHFPHHTDLRARHHVSTVM